MLLSATVTGYDGSGAIRGRTTLDAAPPGREPEIAYAGPWCAARWRVDARPTQADILAVRAGLMTLKEAIARQGYDPAQVLAEIGATNGELDALGIVLDTDPRKATKTGAAKPADENQGTLSG